MRAVSRMVERHCAMYSMIRPAGCIESPPMVHHLASSARIVGVLLLSLLGGACGDAQSPEPSGSSSQASPPLDASSISAHNAAIAAMGRFDYGAAFDLLEPLAAANDQWLDGQVDLSIAQLNRQQAGDETAALDRLEGVLARDGAHLRAQYTAGILRSVLETPEAALAHFQVVAEADPGDAHAAYFTGQALSQQSRWADAVVWFARAIEANAYLRSSYYAGAQAARRAGDTAQADAWLETFQRMEHNPRAELAEVKYTRMGRRAEVQAIDALETPPVPRPEGDVFNYRSMEFKGCDHCPPYAGVSVAWIGDDRNLVLCPTAQSCELMTLGPQSYLEDVGAAARSADAPSITRSTMVRAALWGDVDADGHVDVVLCRNGVNELWLGAENLSFQRDERFIGGATSGTVDGALFDADHDGDLDALFLQFDGALQLMNNNGDGTWQDITDRAFGGTAAISEGRELVVADFDGDLDTDVLCIGQSPPHRMLINDRLWNWHAGDASWSSLLGASIDAAVAADFDADGEVDLITMDDDWALHVWRRQPGGWAVEQLAASPKTPDSLIALDRARGRPRHLAVADLTGDGRMDVLAETGWVAGSQLGRPPILQVVANDGSLLQQFMGETHWALVQRDVSKGPAFIGAGAGGSITTVPAGEGRFPFVDVQLAGRIDSGEFIRSNASGIGATLAARIGTRWSIAGGVRNTAGPGQNLQPVSMGLGGADAVDFIAIDWTDGVYQTEADLRPGEVHRVAETQRQLSSCPVLFGWDGNRMAFITDCLGVGGIGFLLKPGVYAPSRPRERVLLPAGALAARDDVLELIVAQPMQETCYLDDVSLVIVDLPEGWEVLPDERMGTGGAEPTGELFFAQQSMLPSAVQRGDGADMTSLTADLDRTTADPAAVDTRFIGRTVDEFVLTVWFDEALDAHDGTPLLVLDAWVEYPYAQTMFAAWQAGVTYEPLSVDIQLSSGEWVEFAHQVGYPAGMPRTMVLPLHDLPPGATALRLRTTLDCHVDRLRIAWAVACPQARVARLGPSSAVLEQVGFPLRQDGPQRRPGYDWSTRVPFWDTRTQAGLYTALGDVQGLLEKRDGALAVFGAGEAVRLTFAASEASPMSMQRHFVLDLGGWAKDMDLMTRTGPTVDPLPGERDSRADALQAATRNRWRDGR